MRIGVGYDVHQFTEDRPLILGGLQVPYHKGLLGHSDADVLIHSIIDAMLGAAGLDDIGAHFPDTDPEWKGADSMKLLAGVKNLINGAGYKVGNIDATIVLQLPKLRPHILKMRKNMADVIGVPVSDISVKATTNEKMGWIGREEGIAVHAVCLLVKL